MAIRIKDGLHYDAATDQKKQFIRINPDILGRAESIEANDDRTIPVIFSSDAEVEMWYGTEILEHGQENVDLSYLNSRKSPVMIDHWWSSDRQIGVIEDARVEDGMGYATLRFSKSVKANEYYQDILDGIRSCLSVGYDVQEWRVENADTDDPLYVATKWTPREISVVTFPADDAAEVIRGHRSDFIFNLSKEEQTQMRGKRNKNQESPPERSEAQEETQEEAGERGGDPNGEPTGDQSRSEPTGGDSGGNGSPVGSVGAGDGDLTSDARSIIQLCEQLEQLEVERGVQAIRDGVRFVDFQAQVISELANVQVGEGGEVEVDESARFTGTDVDPKDLEKFRVLNLISGHFDPDGTIGGFEREICDEEKTRLNAAGVAAKGYCIPGSVLGSRAEWKARHRRQRELEARALVYSTDAQGGHLVDEELLIENFIEILYANHPVSGAANWITDVMGTIAIPKQNGRVVANWTTETGAAQESTPTFELIQMSPKELRGMVTWSRTFSLLTTIDAENYARGQLMKQIGEQADELLLYGTGASNQISGITQIPAIKNSPFSQRDLYSKDNGITFNDCLTAISKVGNANAMGSMAQWILSWNFWKQAKGTEQLPHGDLAICDDMDMIAGFSAEATSQCRDVEGADTDSDQAFFGNWEHLLVPQWGGIEIGIDPNSRLHTGVIRAVAFMRIDTGIAHDEAFIQLKRTV